MQKAFVLINVEAGCEDAMLKELRKIDGVEEAYFSYGVYDLMLKVRADTMDNLKDLVTHRVRALDNVRSTLTLIIME